MRLPACEQLEKMSKLPEAGVDSPEQLRMFLDQFVQCQQGESGYVEALAEITKGCKTGHWIWYIVSFPLNPPLTPPFIYFNPPP